MDNKNKININKLEDKKDVEESLKIINDPKTEYLTIEEARKYLKS